jgi:hypothetical protein
LEPDLAQRYPSQEDVIRVPDVVMARMSDELVSGKVPNIPQIYAKAVRATIGVFD